MYKKIHYPGFLDVSFMYLPDVGLYDMITLLSVLYLDK